MESIRIGEKEFEIVAPLGERSVLTKGSKVKCISIGEHASSWGNNSPAHELLTIGETYTLSEDPEVHSWHTKYYLEKFPDEKFNSVQFREVRE